VAAHTPPPPSLKTVDVTVGTRLGKYEILKRLATGGMAEIFLARVSGLPGFQKMVVVKRILPQLSTKADFVEMFLDEARIAATLQHPNVVQMYDVGVVDGSYFIAMEYLHGEDVRSLMKALFRRGKERLPLEHALNIVIGVAAGLHYAHEKVGFDGQALNIVHRDVTPQNVIVTYEGGVKLLDFGIAKASNRFGETRFGTLKGKVPYMSPEQCTGQPLDRRSDIFSLGIMLYELTLGRRLYRGTSDFEILKQIVEGTVARPRAIDPAYHPGLETIVMRALEKEPAARYQTARELQAQLEALVRDERLYVSPIALAQFMESVFGHKIEAWREARARGKSLGEHLVAERASDDGELEETHVEDPEALERARREREALLAAYAARRDEDDRPTGVAPGAALGAHESLAAHESLGAHGAHSPPVEDAPRVSEAASLESLLVPQRRWAPLVMAAVGVVAIAAVAAWKLVGRRRAASEPVSPRSQSKSVSPHSLTPGDAQNKPVNPHSLTASADTDSPISDGAGAAANKLVGPRSSTPAAGAFGIVKVTTAPSGAALYLDGRRLPSLSPATLDEVPAGDDHVLLVELEGHKDAVTHFALHAHEVRSVAVRLAREHHHHSDARAAAPPAPAPASLDGEGTLVVASTPWCNLTVDGQAKGPTPLTLKLRAGRHTIVLTNPEFKINRTLPVTIAPNETVRKKLDFN
jgi:serine/threonine-protein kinase